MKGRATRLDWLVHDPMLLLDGKSMDRSRAEVGTAPAGPRPERRVWIDSLVQPVSVRDRPRQTDSASLFGSQPRCSLRVLTTAKALIRGRQVFQLHQARWCRGVGIRQVGRPTRELAFQVPLRRSRAVPFKFLCFFFFSGGGYEGRGGAGLYISADARPFQFDVFAVENNSFGGCLVVFVHSPCRRWFARRLFSFCEGVIL